MREKERERERERLTSVLFAAIWSRLVKSWPGIKCTFKTKYKTLGNR